MIKGPRSLPPVNAVLDAVRAALAEARAALLEGRGAATDPDALARRALVLIDRRESDPGRLRPVLNATGIVLHTGLGRAPWAEEAVERASAVARGFCNLEFELEEGERGRRTSGVVPLIRELTGAEAATVVNNNAAATVLALRALAAGREVVVSRGELIEIGGGFRLPEVFEVSGARLREVGTTNKTRLDDYRRALGPNTAALLRVHPSNYRIVGFTEQAPLPDLARLAHDHGLWMIDDIGSGTLAPGLPSGVDGEPTAAEGIAAGADVVLFSGDKLLGGPQCGVLAGAAPAIRRIEADPMMRALRVDKTTLAALEATLQLVRDGRGPDRLPVWRMIAAPLEELAARAEGLARAFRDLGLNASVVAAESQIGGGSAPVRPIPTRAVRVDPPFPPPHETERAWARALRLGGPPVVARIQAGAVLFDPRTLAVTDEPPLIEAVRIIGKID
ncbi:L-seryl-tRNA(Sec) selenium transferase [Paludisphaera borealis]|uniref:L-seryl-tRNA(Sec) selenium transferase n=1 Tax=Paludisphaera borealis TaxID=1387353 RepID=UPI001AEFBFB4|nr:L-seryl-tRNA(Sec) selenium transferase [Paludisphaera borealis]